MRIFLNFNPRVLSLHIIFNRVIKRNITPRKLVYYRLSWMSSQDYHRHVGFKLWKSKYKIYYKIIHLYSPSYQHFLKIHNKIRNNIRNNHWPWQRRKLFLVFHRKNIELRYNFIGHSKNVKIQVCGIPLKRLEAPAVTEICRKWPFTRKTGEWRKWTSSSCHIRKHTYLSTEYSHIQRWMNALICGFLLDISCVQNLNFCASVCAQMGTAKYFSCSSKHNTFYISLFKKKTAAYIPSAHSGAIKPAVVQGISKPLCTLWS